MDRREITYNTLKYRWIPLARAKSISEMKIILDKTVCLFCRYRSEYKQKCPLYSGSYGLCVPDCCDGLFSIFASAYKKEDFLKAHQMANAIVWFIRTKCNYWDEIEDIEEKPAVPYMTIKEENLLKAWKQFCKLSQNLIDDFQFRSIPNDFCQKVCPVVGCYDGIYDGRSCAWCLIHYVVTNINKRTE